MTPELLFDYLAVRLNGERAAGKTLKLNVNFTDLKQSYALMIQNGVLDHRRQLQPSPDVTLTLSKATLDRIQLRETTIDAAVRAGELKIEGRREAFDEFFALLDTFDFWFNIVTP
jgi:alkyl sulfatase BDS1-like metallo-beta-lactamase superfamily hydrolase